MSRIDVHNIGTTTQGGGFDVGQAYTALQGRVGNLFGEQILVKPKDTASVLADAAEEISMAHSEKVENKVFSDRKFEIESPMDLMGVREIQAYLRAAGKLDDQAKVEQLVKNLLTSRGDPRELVRQQSRDPAQQYVLLQLALHEAREGEQPREIIERLQDALADLEMESGPRIRASINTMGVAVEMATTPEGRAVFQEAYRDVVLGHATLADTLMLVLERLGGADGDDFQKGLQGLIKALGADLSALRPSSEPNRLRALVQDLYQLEVTATVLDGCKALAQRMKARYGARDLDAVAYMKELVRFTGERWLSVMRFIDLAQRFRLNETVERIAFFTATRELLAEMPVKVFADVDSRRGVLDAAQSALDEAIKKEEDEEDEHQGEESS